MKTQPHQLRHSCATLLLNSGTPIQTVKTILGHKFVDTTMRYARLYDGRVAADYYQAMAEIEENLFQDMRGNTEHTVFDEIVELLDKLSAGRLDSDQSNSINSLKSRVITMSGITNDI